MSEKMIPENENDILRELNIFSAKNLIINALVQDSKFYLEFMTELRQKMLFEKVKIKLFPDKFD